MKTASSIKLPVWQSMEGGNGTTVYGVWNSTEWLQAHKCNSEEGNIKHAWVVDIDQ